MRVEDSPLGAVVVIELKRDVGAIAIPHGQKEILPAGRRVSITQELGGTFTVMSDSGMFRIEGKDADALGRQAPAMTQGPAVDSKDVNSMTQRIWDQLKTCYDPEIPVSMVELGLVYEVKVEPLPEGGFHADIKFTLTAPGCGMGDVLRSEVQQKVNAVPGVRKADVELVLEPPWDPSRMSEAVRLQLGMM